MCYYDSFWQVVLYLFFQESFFHMFFEVMMSGDMADSKWIIITSTLKENNILDLKRGEMVVVGHVKTIYFICPADCGAASYLDFIGLNQLMYYHQVDQSHYTLTLRLSLSLCSTQECLLREVHQPLVYEASALFDLISNWIGLNLAPPKPCIVHQLFTNYVCAFWCRAGSVHWIFEAFSITHYCGWK